MKQKIVFIAPHLSTGGMPQYLFKQIESILQDMDVYCIEWDNVTGGVLVVQRNKISNILGERLITLDRDKHKLFDILNELQPDIIHLQEIPELFMSPDIADKLYSVNRNYAIIETSHDSGYDPNRDKRYLPDKFLMVSRYQANLYKDIDVPCEVVEYPIENKIRTMTREEALARLGLDPSIKHVINVGLFTPRKNQAEVIEYARKLQGYPIQFHFIGNQADNFKFYWEPLIKDFPSNCKWWNERSDVDAFYEAADLFLFTSRGSSTDHETMPLVIREALSWKTPSLIYNLPVYMGYFDECESVDYLGMDIEENVRLIKQKLLGNLPESITKMTYNFNSRWDAEEQKILYSVDKTIDFPIIAALKEYKSDAVMWSSMMKTMEANIEFWIMPIAKHMFDYSTDPYCMGVKFCIYRADTEEQLYEMPFIQKFVNNPTVTLSNRVPYLHNYKEFYLFKKYDKWLAKPHGLIVDVGANVGVFTKYMLDSNYARHSIMIECDNFALRDLYTHFRNNPHVTITPRALSNSKEPVTFYHSPENPVISSTLTPDQLEFHMAGVKGNVAYSVDTITIKELVDRYNIIDLLKIDIEGGEYDVLLNADESLFRNIRSLMIECHFFQSTATQNYIALTNKLRGLGYIIDEFMPSQENTALGTSENIYAYRP